MDALDFDSSATWIPPHVTRPAPAFLPDWGISSDDEADCWAEHFISLMTLEYLEEARFRWERGHAKLAAFLTENCQDGSC